MLQHIEALIRVLLNHKEVQLGEVQLSEQNRILLKHLIVVLQSIQRKSRPPKSKKE